MGVVVDSVVWVGVVTLLYLGLWEGLFAVTWAVCTGDLDFVHYCILLPVVYSFFVGSSGRYITQNGQRELDTIAGQVVVTKSVEF